jgi:hypothetical protein
MPAVVGQGARNPESDSAASSGHQRRHIQDWTHLNPWVIKT